MCKLLTAKSSSRIESLYLGAPCSAVTVGCKSDAFILRRGDILFLSLWHSLQREVLLLTGLS